MYRLRGLYERYGYRRFKMSKFEEYDLYVRNKDFLVSDRMITFTDARGILMALKPDVTLSIIKTPGRRRRAPERSTTMRASTGPARGRRPSRRLCRPAWSASGN